MSTEYRVLVGVPPVDIRTLSDEQLSALHEQAWADGDEFLRDALDIVIADRWIERGMP